MIIRKTVTTLQKRIWRDKCATSKSWALYRVITYWFLFIPIYRYEQFID